MKHQPIDIVYPIGSGCEWGEFEELRYSIRSACKYVQGLRNIYLVGHRPIWATDVIHLPMGDPHTQNKDANLIEKVLRACMQYGLSERFIRMSDDQYFLRPWLLQEHLQPLAYGNIVADGVKWRGDATKKYHQKIIRTRDTLLKQGCDTWFYDTHSPAVYHKDLFVQAMSQVDYKMPPGFTINTLYFNLIGTQPCGRELFEMRYELPNHHSLEHITKKCAGRYFLNNTPGGISDGLKQYLAQEFGEKCRFEV
jgi:hypothetical protein